MDNSKNSSKIKELDNVVFTPHIAFNTNKALFKYTDTAVKNLKAYLQGCKKNVVFTETN